MSGEQAFTHRAKTHARGAAVGSRVLQKWKICLFERINDTFPSSTSFKSWDCCDINCENPFKEICSRSSQQRILQASRDATTTVVERRTEPVKEKSLSAISPLSTNWARFNTILRNDQWHEPIHSQAQYRWKRLESLKFDY